MNWWFSVDNTELAFTETVSTRNNIFGMQSDCYVQIPCIKTWENPTVDQYLMARPMDFHPFFLWNPRLIGLRPKKHQNDQGDLRRLNGDSPIAPNFQRMTIRRWPLPLALVELHLRAVGIYWDTTRCNGDFVWFSGIAQSLSPRKGGSFLDGPFLGSGNIHFEGSIILTRPQMYGDGFKKGQMPTKTFGNQRLTVLSIIHSIFFPLGMSETRTPLIPQFRLLWYYFRTEHQPELSSMIAYIPWSQFLSTLLLLFSYYCYDCRCSYYCLCYFCCYCCLTLFWSLSSSFLWSSLPLLLLQSLWPLSYYYPYRVVYHYYHDSQYDAAKYSFYHHVCCYFCYRYRRHYSYYDYEFGNDGYHITIYVRTILITITLFLLLLLLLLLLIVLSICSGVNVYIT